MNISSKVNDIILNAEAEKLGIDPNVYKSMSDARRQQAKNAYNFKMELARVQAEDRARIADERIKQQQATTAEPVEAVPVQVVTQAPACSKWFYMAIGAAVAWLILGRL